MNKVLPIISILALAACGGGGGGSTTPTTPLAEISIADTSIVEGDSGTTAMIFTLTLSKESSTNVTVDYETSNDTATAGKDYMAASGTVTFEKGETTQTISVDVVGDILYADEDGEETFNVNLGNGSVAISDANAIGTILNDDMSKKEAFSQFNSLVDMRLVEYRGNVTDDRSCACERFINIDLDNDADIDHVMFVLGNNDHAAQANTYQQAMIYRNNEGKGFSEEASGLYAALRDYEIDDFNGDGLDDVVLVGHGYDYDPFPGTQDYYFMQDSNGMLVDLTTSNMPQIKDFSHGSCKADFNNDGYTDIYIAAGDSFKLLINNGVDFTSKHPLTNYEQLSASYALENGFVSFGQGREQDFISQTTFWWCEATDADGDGDMDVILGGGMGSHINDLDGNSLAFSHVILFNHGTAEFTYDNSTSMIPSSEFSGAVTNMIAYDFNSDGCEDLVTNVTDYQTGQDINVYESNCDGTYSVIKTISNPNGDDHGYLYDEFTDLNNDGAGDFIMWWYSYDGTPKNIVIESNGTSNVSSRVIAEEDLLKLTAASAWYLRNHLGEPR